MLSSKLQSIFKQEEVDWGRVNRGWEELLDGYEKDPKKFLVTFKDSGYDQLICLGPMEFHSICSHHLLSFQGVVFIGYIPKGKVLGISKLPRIVECFSHRLQMQEKMTREIAYFLRDNLELNGVGVIVRAHHLCMCSRGAKSNSIFTTSEMLGSFREENSVRQEFLKLVEMNEKYERV